MEPKLQKRLPARTRPPIEQDRLANWFRKRILEGKLQPGEKLPSRPTLVEHFKVSIMTVQRAMNQLIADGFIETRGPAGSFVAKKPSNEYRIGLAFHPLHHDAPEWSTRWEALLAAAERLEKESPYRFTTYAGVDVHMDTEDCRRLEMDIGHHALAGLLLDKYSAQALVQQKFDNHNIPVIGLSPCKPKTGIPVIPNNLEVFYDCALERLKAEGCRNIATVILATSENWNMIPMVRRCFKKHGLAWRDGWAQGAPYSEGEWARQSVRILFDKNNRIHPDALIVSDDNLTLSVSNALLDLSIRVPEDLRVISLCNYPAIPAVNMDVEWIGPNLVDMLKNVIDLFGRLRQGLPIPELAPLPAQYFGNHSIKA